MKKTLIEQLDELKAKIKEEEKVVVGEVLGTLDEIDLFVEDLKEQGNRLVPNENLAIHLSHLITVLGNTRTAFEQAKVAVTGVAPVQVPISTL